MCVVVCERRGSTQQFTSLHVMRKLSHSLVTCLNSSASLRRIGHAASTNDAAASPSAADASSTAGEEDVITPWSVVSKGPKGIDYDRVLTQFKSDIVDAPLLERLTRVVEAHHARKGTTAPPLHPILRRGVAFSHRDINLILDDVEAQKTFYLYTGRGPSAQTMHVGHMMPFLVTHYLQEAFNVPLVIQMTDDEKFLFRDVPLGPQMDKMCSSNIKDIIAFGFDPKKTFIFRNTRYMGELYPTVVEVQRCITANAAKNTFGFSDSDNIGKIAFAAIQAAPSFVSAFRQVLPVKGHNMKCLIPCAIDQDPFFVLTRSISERLKRPRPALLHTKFLPALKGPTHKMSSSAEDNGVILLTDTDDVIRRKLRKAFSGGAATLEELRSQGANLDADVAYQFINVFSKDDAFVADIAERYKSGKLHSGQVKDIAADVLIGVLGDWRRRRANVTDADVETFCSVRNILY